MKSAKKWHVQQHYVIVNVITGAWVQQAYTPRPDAVRTLNQHELLNGRAAKYCEQYFSTEQIQEYNEKVKNATPK